MDFRTLPRMDHRPREFYDPKDHRYVSREKLNIRAAADLVRECAADAMGKSFRDEHVSPVEIDLLAAMWYCELEPWPQYSLPPYWADFYFPETHVAVEVDGRQWHQVDRDRKRDAYLRNVHDVVVRRFTGQSVYTNPLAVARDVEGTYTWIFDRLHLVVPAARKAA